MAVENRSANVGVIVVLLALAGCEPVEPREPYCSYYDWAIDGAKDMRQCIEAGTCKPTATEYADMRRRERACPWKFHGVEK